MAACGVTKYTAMKEKNQCPEGGKDTRGEGVQGKKTTLNPRACPGCQIGLELSHNPNEEIGKSG